KVKDLIESVDCKILFLPTYSPDLNPIEHYWFKIKQQIRKTAGISLISFRQFGQH
ncbi:MAG: transposase, partial [Rickettsia sp.]|nr:transposase [Rickettsia sp.]